MIKHISSDCKFKFNSTTCNSNQKWNNNKFQCGVKSITSANNPSTYVYKNSRYLKSSVDDSVIARDKIMSIANNVSANVTNTISKNVTSPVSINFNDKKVRYKMDCYIFHTFLLVTK